MQIVIDRVFIFGVRGNEGVFAGFYVLADLVHSGVVAAVAVCTGDFYSEGSVFHEHDALTLFKVVINGIILGEHDCRGILGEIIA